MLRKGCRRSSPTDSRRKPSARRRKLVLELLEDRRLLAAFSVNSIGSGSDFNPGDGIADVGKEECDTFGQNCQFVPTGETTLAAAIEEANALAGADVIQFDLPGAAPHTIEAAATMVPDSELTIDGCASAEPSIETLTCETGVIIKGRPGIGTGIALIGGTVTVQGLVINGFSIGIDVVGGENHVIQSNLIGTDHTGTERRDNIVGINVIGTDGVTIQSNVISGSSSVGVRLGESDGNTLTNNIIGLDATGTAAKNREDVKLGNRIGVELLNSRNNVIGAGNIISGNIETGIYIYSGDDDGVPPHLPVSSGNMIRQVIVGTDAGQTRELGNGQHGIYIEDAENNTVEKTVIVNNGATGVTIRTSGLAINQATGELRAKATGNVIKDSYIGTDETSSRDLGNENEGVLIDDASLNTVGPRNVIGNNGGIGVHVLSSGTLFDQGELQFSRNNSIEGNLIGINGDDQDIGNASHGVSINGGVSNRVQSGSQTGAGLKNKIAFNQGDGVRIQNASDNFITSSEIHTNRDAGIALVDSVGTSVGGARDGLGNTITRNGKDGIRVLGSQSNNHVFQRNSIFFNGEEGIFSGSKANPLDDLGIDFGDDGRNENDLDDPDDGPNHLQNSPQITDYRNILAGGTVEKIGEGEDGGRENKLEIKFFFTSAPGKYRIEFFDNLFDKPGVVDLIDAEGKDYIGETDIEVTESGKHHYTVQLPDRTIFAMTATATRLVEDLPVETSEFSKPFAKPNITVEENLEINPRAIRWDKIDQAYELQQLKVVFHNKSPIDLQDVFLRITDGAKQELESTTILNWPGNGKQEVTLTNLDIMPYLGSGEGNLSFIAEADPHEAIDESNKNDNKRTASLSLDLRPQVTVFSKFGSGYFMAGTPLPNNIDVNVDWNGSLDDDLVTDDEARSVDFFLNDILVHTTEVEFADDMPAATHTIDLGSDLRQGTNTVEVVAVNAAGFTTVAINRKRHYTQLGIPGWLTHSAASVREIPAGQQYNKEAEYKYGFKFPEFKLSGLFGVDDVSLAKGPNGLVFGVVDVRAEFRSNGHGAITGKAGTGSSELKIGGKTVKQKRKDLKELEKDKGAEETTDESGFLVRGKLVAAPNYQLEPHSLEAGIFLQGEKRVSVPAYTFVPPFLAPAVRAANVRGVGRFQGEIEATLGIDATQQGNLDWKPGLRFGLDVSAAVLLSAGYGWAYAEGGVGGTLDLDFTLPAASFACILDRATLQFFAEASFQVFTISKTYKWKLPEEPLVLTECQSDSSTADGEGSVAEVSPNFTRQVQLSATEKPLAGESEGNGLPAVSYALAAPSVAVGPDGTMTMVYVDEAPGKQNGQQLEIMASHFDGSNWSVPVSLTDNTLLDAYPSVADDQNGKAVVVWTQTKNTIEDIDNTALPELLGAAEVMYATWDPQANTWSVPVALTNNATTDMVPRVVSDAQGNLAAMWLNESDNVTPLFPDDPSTLGADVLFSQWDGNGWSEPAAAVVGINGNKTPQFAVSGDEAIFVWSDDLDGDAATTGDSVIKASTREGQAWSTGTMLEGTDDGLDDVSPRVVYDSAGNANIVWAKQHQPTDDGSEENESLMFSMHVDGAFTTPAVAVTSAAFTELRLLIDDNDNLFAVWQSSSDLGADTFYAVYDRSAQDWSDAIQLTDDANIQSAFNPFINAAGELEIISLEREVEMTPVAFDVQGQEVIVDIPKPIQSSLASQRRMIGHDLVISDLQLAESPPTPGGTVEVTATITNLGDYTTSPVRVALFDDGVQVGTTETLADLGARKQVTATFQWQVPATPNSRHTLTARVDPDDEVDEKDEDNNEIRVATLLPDLVVDYVITTTSEEDSVTVVAGIMNQGVTDAQGPFTVALRLDAADAENSLATVEIAAPLAPGASTEVQFEVTDVLNTLGAVQLGWVVADAPDSVQEADEQNNAAYGALNPYTSWQNPADEKDINDDGFVVPLDVLIVINYLNDFGPDRLPEIPLPPSFYDVNGDDFVSPIDALLIINFLNEPGAGEGESEKITGRAAEAIAQPSSNNSDVPVSAPFGMLAPPRWGRRFSGVPPIDHATDRGDPIYQPIVPAERPAASGAGQLRHDAAMRGSVERSGRIMTELLDQELALMLDEIAADIAGTWLLTSVYGVGS